MSVAYAFLPALEARQDLKVYGDNALLLFALQHRWAIEDIHAVAAQSLIDGPDDKSCDLVYVDADRRIAVVAQTYFAHKLKEVAPAKKADDLHTAASWILGHDLEKLPERLQPAAIELREALQNRYINAIEFWYVHNCPESPNVGKALAPVAILVRDVLRSQYPDCGCKDVHAFEIGSGTIEGWYQDSKTPIVVGDTFVIDIGGGYEVANSKEWSAFATALPAKWLYQQYKAYGERLFSANVRDFLGVQKRDSGVAPIWWRRESVR